MNKLLQDLINGHERNADLYRQLANERCAKHDAYGVYQAIKESMTEEAKARRLANQFGREM